MLSLLTYRLRSFVDLLEVTSTLSVERGDSKVSAVLDDGVELERTAGRFRSEERKRSFT